MDRVLSWKQGDDFCLGGLVSGGDYMSEASSEEGMVDMRQIRYLQGNSRSGRVWVRALWLSVCMKAHRPKGSL